jgi:hypothetical protein
MVYPFVPGFESGYIVSIPDRDSMWLKQVMEAIEEFDFEMDVSIPDRDSMWLKHTINLIECLLYEFQSLIGIQCG